ncbi:pilus assembly protein CpaE [Naasia aerilata]|uniref:Pilus assembly protein CpaE n=1 Tax=Naasia aerilata TaxID=1162966 RepID=A0ABM8G986_9MICO|nr:pilus assembly protein CpaE [Naasia aerilata]BDZ44754.1 hypothetical protein GCM10025866_06630 [Naasia aerilata]
MISRPLALALRTAGLRWKPESGDRFSIQGAELSGDVFTLSDMTIEAHSYPTGTILGFNGTTEWALDSVAIEDALWLPREDQLRELLGGTFRGLRPDGEGYVVDIAFRGKELSYSSPSAADAYAEALLTLVAASSPD